MPELRYNIATREWVIIATDRAKRPEDFAGKATPPLKDDSAANCPFCSGRESKTPAETFAIRPNGSQANTPGWKVRAMPNAFPALKPEGSVTRQKIDGTFLRMDGFGIHEVIIETPEHEQVMATMAIAQVEDVFAAYLERFTTLAKDSRFESIVLFKNHGRNAGTSLHHPHSQVVAMPVTPKRIRDNIEIAMGHFDQYGTCIYCDMIKSEIAAKERLVLQTDEYIAFVPYASRLPFETWVLPKIHQANYDEVGPEGNRALARVIKTILEKFYRSLSNPDFNYAIYSSPCREHGLEYYHWSLKIFPRITGLAGFEIGSGMSINVVVPEAAAKYLREA